MITYLRDLRALPAHNPSALANQNKIAGEIITRVIARDSLEPDDGGSELPTAIFHFNPMSSHTEETCPCCVCSPCIGCDRYLAWRILASDKMCIHDQDSNQ